MSGPSHDRLIHRHALRAQLVTETALHVGTSESARQMAATDLPVARDGRGSPYIPGSSFRGALRSGLESLLRGLARDGQRVCDPFVREDADGKVAEEAWSCGDRVRKERADLVEIREQEAFDLAWKQSCAICRLFGHVFLASRVRVADLFMLAEADDRSTYIRDGVGLDRDLRTASPGILYNFEAVPAQTPLGYASTSTTPRSTSSGCCSSVSSSSPRVSRVSEARAHAGWARRGSKGSPSRCIRPRTSLPAVAARA